MTDQNAVGLKTKAADLREAGWLVLAPERLEALLSLDGPSMRVWLLAYIEAVTDQNAIEAKEGIDTRA